MHIDFRSLIISLLFFLIHTPLVSASASNADSAELMRSSLSTDAEIALPALLTLAETGGENINKFIYNRLKDIPVDGPASKPDNVILLFSFFRESSQYQNIDKLFAMFLKDRNYLSQSNRGDALLAGIGLSASCHNDEWIAKVEDLGKGGENHTKLIIYTLLAFRLPHATQAAFSIFDKVDSIHERSQYIVQCFSRYRSSPEIIDGFRAIIRVTDPTNEVFKSIVAVNLDLWNDQWTKGMSSAVNAFSHDEYSIEGLKELIQLEQDFLSCELSGEMHGKIVTCRNGDCQLLETKVEKYLSDQLKMQGWKIQMTIRPP